MSQGNVVTAVMTIRDETLTADIERAKAHIEAQIKSLRERGGCVACKTQGVSLENCQVYLAAELELACLEGWIRWTNRFWKGTDHENILSAAIIFLASKASELTLEYVLPEHRQEGLALIIRKIAEHAWELTQSNPMPDADQPPKGQKVH